MKEELKIACLQIDLAWENKTANLDRIQCMLEQNKGADLYVLPEMFSTGFSMNANAFAEYMEGPTVTWMKAMAKKMEGAIIGSLIIEENGNYFNRLILAQENGKIHTYDKRHLFSYAKEEETYTAGQNSSIVEYKGWRIKPLVCYDLRFPVWSRNTEDYDILIYVANWPNRRSLAWKSLLKARAIENMAYCIGVNRVGEDGNNVFHSGDTMAVDPLGEELIDPIDSIEKVELILVKKEVLKNYRSKFGFLNDRDDFQFKS